MIWRRLPSTGGSPGPDGKQLVVTVEEQFGGACCSSPPGRMIWLNSAYVEPPGIPFLAGVMLRETLSGEGGAEIIPKSCPPPRYVAGLTTLGLWPRKYGFPVGRYSVCGLAVWQPLQSATTLTI